MSGFDPKELAEEIREIAENMRNDGCVTQEDADRIAEIAEQIRDVEGERVVPN